MIPRRVSMVLALALAMFAVPKIARCDDPKVDPRQLVEKLADVSFSTREGAYRKLQGMGKDALDAVKLGAEHPNAEVRRRCNVLLAILARPIEDKRWDEFIGKKSNEGPAGWDAFREMVGDDSNTRYLFVKMHQADAELMNSLVKDKAKAGGLIAGRTVGLQQKIGRAQQMGEAFDPFPAFLAVMHAVNAAKPKLDLNNQYQICNLFHQQGINQQLRDSEVGKKLMGHWLMDVADVQVQRNQAPYLASNFGLTELVQTKLRPAAEALVKESVANPEDQNKFYQAINMCQTLRLTDILDAQLKPMVRKRLEAATKEPIDANRLNMAANSAQSLNMQAEASALLKPALTKMAENVAKGNMLDPAQLNQFYSVLNLSRSFGAPEIIDNILRPAGQRTLIEASAKSNDVNQMFQIINLAQNLELREVMEPLMKPAAERMIRATIQNKQFANLQQAFSLTQQMGFRMEDLDKAIRENAVEAVEKRQPLVQVHQAVQLLRQTGGDPATEKRVEAGLTKLFAEIASKPINANDVYQGIQMAREWNLKEGAEFAVKAASANSIPAYARGQALAYLAQSGTKEILPKLETLLDDKTSFGRTNINSMSVETQMRDAALMVMVCITNQDFEKYGFALSTAMRNQNPAQLPPNWWGFQDEAARTKAIERWREYRKKG